MKRMKLSFLCALVLGALIGLLNQGDCAILGKLR